ncbi:hypothetical protein CPB83DRAFT_850497 [Crepidotus variabilis]|uniref:Uncharacterized protein n=1 Tax=Crepidotus variabilis TaxID=179855 RepID=A0A9P6JRS2_9AGAR|nr:hypothetical protein CPB83DRAFT_850497 [Crepidotus variabilis]
MSEVPHPELQTLRRRLIQIHEALENFKPLIPRPPILDSSFDKTEEPGEENQWLQQGITIPGLRKLKDDIKIDLGILDKFLDDPNCVNLPPISTNAPYVISVWNEVLCAPPPLVSVFKTFLLNPSDQPQEKPKLKGKEKQKEKNPPGAKVDIIADNGRRWIRVNTIKNARLHAEFCEIDSYLTDSDEESQGGWDDQIRPSLAQTQFDNSVLRMGRSLLAAAEANPIDGTNEVPVVTLRLSRLNPNSVNEDGKPPDPRIAQTLEQLREMGVEVALGERSDTELPDINQPHKTDPPRFSPQPTKNINLDLSVLIALISDLTHSPLPTTIDEANKRFVPPPEYREWKQKRMEITGKKSRPDRRPPNEIPPPGMEKTIHELPRDLIKHAKALTNQLLQEMSGGILQEISDQLMSTVDLTPTDSKKSSKIMFWTTAEARERCLRIVSKIGGFHEKRRVRALFQLSLDHSPYEALAPTTVESAEIPLEEAEKLYWQDSRFPLCFIPLLPIHILPDTSPLDLSLIVAENPSLRPYTQLFKGAFTSELGKVCYSILSQDTAQPPNLRSNDHLVADSRSLQGVHDSGTSTPSPDHVSTSEPLEDIQRARVTTANPRLTVHTVHCMQWGAELGWTTLTANRTSVKAILKEMKAARVSGRLAGVVTSSSGSDDQLNSEAGTETAKVDDIAAIWIVDPRSLAEGMSSQPAS